MLQLDAAAVRLALRTLQTALDAGDEVEVAIKRGRRCQLGPRVVRRWVAHAGALRPGLVLAGAGQGAGADGAAGAAVFGGRNVANTLVENK